MTHPTKTTDYIDRRAAEAGGYYIREPAQKPQPQQEIAPMTRLTVTATVRAAVGLEEGQEPAFWPNARHLSQPNGLAYLAGAHVWLSCAGDASSGISILYGPTDEGFEWQQTGEQFADYSCRWSRLCAAYDTP